MNRFALLLLSLLWLSAAARAQAWQLAWERQAFPYPIHALAFSPGGDSLAAGGHDCLVGLFEAEGGRELARWAGHYDYIRSLSFAPDGRRLLSGSLDSKFLVWDLASGKPERVAGHEVSCRAVAHAPEGPLWATCDDLGQCRLWRDGRLAYAKPFHAAAINAVAFSAGGEHLYTCSDDGSARWFDAATGAEIGRFQAFGEMALCLAVSADEQWLAVGGLEGKLKIFNLAMGREVASLAAHEGYVSQVVFLGQSDRWASVGADGRMAFGQAGTSELRRLAVREGTPLRALAADAAGKRLATGGQDGSLRLYELSPTP